jgi:hypothetical protein
MQGQQKRKRRKYFGPVFGFLSSFGFGELGQQGLQTGRKFGTNGGEGGNLGFN